MTLCVLIFAALLAAAAPAQAQGQAGFCRLLAGTGADYVPGRDVRGRPVVPADIGGRAASDIDMVRIPLTIDLAGMVGRPLPAFLDETGQAGYVEIRRDGRVLFAGRDMSAQAYTACGLSVPDMPVNIAPSEPELKPEPEPEPEPKPRTWHSIAPAHAPQAGEIVKGTPDGTDDDILWGEGY